MEIISILEKELKTLYGFQFELILQSENHFVIICKNNFLSSIVTEKILVLTSGYRRVINFEEKSINFYRL